MKKENKLGMIYAGVALIWYMAAFLYCISGDTQTGTVCLCVGSTFLACSTIYNSKNTKKSDSEEMDEK